MDSNTLAGTTGTPNLPVKKGFWSELLGQFMTRVFWFGVFRTIIHESAAAFFRSLGSVLIWYGKERSNPQFAQPDVRPTSAPTPSAFTYPRAVTPYSPSYSSPPAPPPPTEPVGFPGFNR